MIAFDPLHIQWSGCWLLSMERLSFVNAFCAFDFMHILRSEYGGRLSMERLSFVTTKWIRACPDMQHNGDKYNTCPSSPSSSSLYYYEAGKVFLLLTPSLINKSCLRQSDGISNISMQTQNLMSIFLLLKVVKYFSILFVDYTELSGDWGQLWKDWDSWNSSCFSPSIWF